MGEGYSVLLPNAKVCLFTTDRDLREAALSLQNDWRFAGVSIETIDGDVETAISSYGKASSPDIVLVETSDIGNDFIGRLEVLAAHCSEKTAAVVVGPVNDVYLYRKLIELGVSDYLVKPLNREVLADVFSKIITERLGASGSRLIATIGAKGGVGVSALTALAGRISAEDFDRKTVLFDASGGASYLSVLMGGDCVTTLHEAARAATSSDKDSFHRMVLKAGEKLFYLASGAESILDDAVGEKGLEPVLDRLMQTYPVVFVDLSSAPADLRRMVLSRANDVLVVTTPALSSLRAARALISEIKALRGNSDVGLQTILNMKGALPGGETSEKDIESSLEVTVSGTIPFLPKFFSAFEGSAKTVREISGFEDAAVSLRKVLRNGMHFSERSTDNADGKKSGLLDGLLGKVMKK